MVAKEKAPPEWLEATRVAQLYAARFGTTPDRLYNRMRNWWNRGLIQHRTPKRLRRPVYVRPAEIEDMMVLQPASSPDFMLSGESDTPEERDRSGGIG